MSSVAAEHQTRRPRRVLPRSPRSELTVALLLGAVGAGLIFLATRQGWAVVRTILPRPLPVSRVTVTGAALVPYADALVVVGIATLAAILASKRLLRRLLGVLLAVIGAGLAASAFALSAATAVSAASSNVSPETAAAGSVMDGSGTATTTAPDVAGTQTHVLFSATGWQVLVVAGAIAMIAAGLAVALRASHMAVMSSRYDSPSGTTGRSGTARRAAPDATATGASGTGASGTGASGTGASGTGASGTGASGTGASGTGASGTGTAAAGGKSDSASLWEALSRGDDPTAAIPPSGR